MISDKIVVNVAEKEKIECCGCEACVQTCPKQCIRIIQDKEGFGYPYVDENICVQCGKCIHVCPTSNILETNSIQNCYAVKNDSDAIRLNSSSGGAFFTTV